MCGFFGWIPSSRFQQYNAHEIALTQCKALRHRGPNDYGFHIFPVNRSHNVRTEQDTAEDIPFFLLLGQTRLSIIDLSSAGHQPICTSDKRFTLVYNGEVYNYRELRVELQTQGYVFHTQTDTEVVLYSLIHWGEEALLRFIGMFSFAFFDAEENILLLARDFFGIKPLYWQSGKQGICFSSELPSLLNFPEMKRQVDPHAAYQFLCYGQYDCGEHTFIQDVQSLPAGHILKISLSTDGYSFLQQCYWRPDLGNISTLRFEDAAEKLRELFLHSVQMHLRSDVPLGVALSGGIDSSAVTCAMRYLEPDMELNTFSFIAKNSSVSEEYWTKLVAKDAQVVLHTVEVEPEELVRDIDKLIFALGEPFGSTSIYAQYRVFQLAHECGIKVTLDGQGADELLAGYHGYQGPRIATLLRARQWKKALDFYKASKQWPGRTTKYIAQQVVREFVPNWLVPLALNCVGRSVTPAWLDMGSLYKKDIVALREDLRSKFFPSGDCVRQTLAYQLIWNGLPQLLRHGDRNSMVHSIESRVPFLTREMAEFCLSLPEEYLIDMHGCSKSIFREAMRGIVPDPVLDRREKIGFATPENAWISILSNWVDEVLYSAKNIPYLYMDKVCREWQDIKNGKKMFDWRVWRWICYTRWVQLFTISE